MLPSSASSSLSPTPGASSTAITAEQYQAEIQRLRGELQRSAVAASEAQAAAAAAVQAATAAAAVHVAGPPSSMVKPQAPHTFSGSVGAGAEQWLMELERWRQAVEIRGVMSDQAFLTFVATYLQGSASLWYNSLVVKGSTPTSWAEFKEVFRERFRPFDAERTARQSLYNLRQREKESVSSYSDAFLKLVNFLPGMAKEDQLALYQRGLLSHIAEELDRIYAVIDGSASHVNLSDVINQAQRIETRLAMSRRGAAASNQSRGSRFAPSPWFNRALPSYLQHGGPGVQQQQVPAADPNRMDLSHIQQQGSGDLAMGSQWTAYPAEQQQYPSMPFGYNRYNPTQDERVLAAMHQRPSAPYRGQIGVNMRGPGPGVPGLSRPEFDQLSREGKCFNCKQTGHLARNCPKVKSLNY
jgi:hypothetical protein